ncbi:MAG: hypothetical protein FJ218_05600 [Ignavibacteria bacterium]|nr:hypothetical protein [Ignavibacteria bacterium]
MPRQVDGVEAYHGVVSIGENTRENAKQSKREKNQRRKTQNNFSKRSSSAGTSNKEVYAEVMKNMKLSFSFEEETGNSKAELENTDTKVSRTLEFEEVTKASENLFERRGVVFDKRA